MKAGGENGMKSGDTQYLEQRIREEEERARMSEDAAVAAAHREMAAAYAEKLKAAESGEMTRKPDQDASAFA